MGCQTSQTSPAPINPEDFSRFFDDHFADDQSQDAAESPLRAYFPV
jgi:hypothetical protein